MNLCEYFDYMHVYVLIMILSMFAKEVLKVLHSSFSPEIVLLSSFRIILFKFLLEEEEQ